MSIIRTPLGIKKLFSRYGDNVSIITRKETVDSDKGVKFSYANTISAKGLVYSASGFRETWYEVGYSEDIDYVICILPTIGEFQYEEFHGEEFYTGNTVSPKDFILMSNDIKVEVKEVNPRGLGFKKYYLECLCKRIE